MLVKGWEVFLHWCGEGDPLGASKDMAEPTMVGSLCQVWMMDSTQQEAAAAIGNLLVVVKCFLSVSDIYKFMSTYRH